MTVVEDFPLGRGTTPAATPVLALEDVSVRFERRLDVFERVAAALGGAVDRRAVQAVTEVDLAIAPGEVLGLVGESGCGKSTLGRVAAGLRRPTAGTARFLGRDVAAMTRAERLDYVLKVQMIFQDPLASLNPRHRVRRIVGEALAVHGLAPPAAREARVRHALEEVGLGPDALDRYPHEFSGGQRQRIGVARALAVEPEALICDEPVAALDVSIQAQVVNLFLDLRERRELTYLFISHDLGLVRHVSDRVAIMYLGRIVELSPARELFAAPNHPYTVALLEEAPRLDRRGRRYTAVKGEIPSPLSPPPGCAFHPRCPHAMPVCAELRPTPREIAPGRLSACWLNERS